MDTKSAEQRKYLSLWSQIAFGMGDGGCNCFSAFVSAFVLIYMTDAVGMNAGVIGTLMMLSRLLDGISDVLFGRIMDKTHTKLGKARPWFIGSAFPLAISTVLLFMIPNSASSTIQYVYFFIIYTFANAICYTANNISYTSLVALATKNPNERVQMGVFRFVVVTLVYIPINAATIPMVSAFGGGIAGWRSTAIVYAICLVVMQCICFLFVKELPEENKTEELKTASLSFLEMLKIVLSNKYYVIILAITILNYITSTILSTMGVYYCTYILHNAEFLGILSLAVMATVVGIVCTPFITKRIGIYKTNLIGYGVSAVIGIPIILFGYKAAGMAVFVLMALRYFLQAPYAATSAALIADVSTYTEYKDGVKMDGMMFSCSSMGIKVGSGLGVAISGFLLNLGGYVGTADEQTQAALNMINFTYLIVPAITIAVVVWLLYEFKVHKVLKAYQAETVSAE